MMPIEFQHLATEFEPDGDAMVTFHAAQELERRQLLDEAATLYNRAFGLDPFHIEIQSAFQSILNRLSFETNGLTFRYIPGGLFLMGDHFSEPDEAPWHPVSLKPFWMMETCFSLQQVNQLMDWNNDTRLHDRIYPNEPGYEFLQEESFMMYFVSRLGGLYSYGKADHLYPRHHEDLPDVEDEEDPDDEETLAEKDAERIDLKPFVAAPDPRAQLLAIRLNKVTNLPGYHFSVPTEAQWEKAARGGFIGEKYSWGSEPVSPHLIDCNRFYQLGIKPMKSLPPNPYGLYGMCGGVWEWTQDDYDRYYYRESPHEDPAGPSGGEAKVIRGGSWADCPEVCTVSFRNTMSHQTDRSASTAMGHMTPTIGVRLVCNKV